MDGEIERTKTGIVLKTEGSVMFAPDWPAIAGLNKKMANVMGQLKAIQEDERHQQGWKYASYSAVATTLRESLSSQGLGFFANLVKYEQCPNTQGKGFRSIVEIEFTFADGETGAMRMSRWAGEGVDFGIADKGLAKAITSAEKYFLMRTFLVSTSDETDPDATSEPQSQAGQKATRKPQVESKSESRQPQPVEPPPDTTRPYRPEIVQQGILSRASKGDQTTAKEGYRGIVIDYLEAIWSTESPDVREARRHGVLNLLFGDPSSKQLTKARCDAILQWLTDKQEDGKRVLNAFAISEAIAMVPSSDDIPI